MATIREKLPDEWFDGRKKLIPCQIERILDLRERLGVSYEHLARVYFLGNVSKQTIYLVCNPEKYEQSKASMKSYNEKSKDNYKDRRKWSARQNRYKKRNLILIFNQDSVMTDTLKKDPEVTPNSGSGSSNRTTEGIHQEGVTQKQGEGQPGPGTAEAPGTSNQGNANPSGNTETGGEIGEGTEGQETGGEQQGTGTNAGNGANSGTDVNQDQGDGAPSQEESNA